MKIRTVTWMLVAMFLLVSMTAAYGHYLWFEPSIKTTAKSGDTVLVHVHLHAELSENIYGWGLNVAFDDSVSGPGELTYVSSVLGTGIGNMGEEGGKGYLPGASSLSSGESLFHFYRYDWTFEGLPLTAGNDYLLATLTFAFTGGAWDGSDLWVEWDHRVPNESFFDVDSVLYWKDNPMQVQPGPDYGASRRKGQPWAPLLLDEEPKATTIGRDKSGSE